MQNAEVNPSDWKRKGYPSEYAYMQDMGLMNIKPKPSIGITVS